MSDKLIIDGFVIDLLVSIKEGRRGQPTRFPVERGAPITDHVVHEPNTMSIEFRVSDTPIGEIYDLRAAGTIPSAEARAFLEELQASDRPFVVEYQDRRWEDQLFTELSFESDFEKQGGLFATAELEQLIVADVRRVVVEGVVLVASKKVQGPTLWHCPDGLPDDPDEAVNKRRGCRGVIKKGTAYYYADTGEMLTTQQVSQMKKHWGGPTLDPVTGQYFQNGHQITVDTAAKRTVEKAIGEVGGLDHIENYARPSDMFTGGASEFQGPRDDDTIRSGRNI